MERESIDLVVVGGGIAGMSAARAAAKAGFRALVLDERAGLIVPDAEGVEVRTDSVVWGIFPGRRIAVAGRVGTYEVSARAVVLACGAVTVVDPVPGWTFPDIRLALMAECSAGYSEALGGWVTGRSEEMETTVHGVFVAGDCAGLCPTPDIAAAEGILAGRSAARSHGCGTADDCDQALKALAALAPDRVAAGSNLHAWYVQGERAAVTPAHAYAEGSSIERTDAFTTSRAAGEIVCPCEQVSTATIEDAITCGARTLNDVKRRTRAGMGICQGLQCGLPIRAMICSRTGLDPSRVPPMTARPPLRVLPLGAFAHAVPTGEGVDGRRQ